MTGEAHNIIQERQTLDIGEVSYRLQGLSYIAL